MMETFLSDGNNPTIDNSKNVIEPKIILYKKEISIGLLILFIIVIIIALNGFSKNQKHDGFPNLLITTVSYATTTTALIVSLLFLR
jgi:hypothetical protein